MIKEIANKKDTVIVHSTEFGKILVYQNYEIHLKLKHPKENFRNLGGRSHKYIEDMLCSSAVSEKISVSLELIFSQDT